MGTVQYGTGAGACGGQALPLPHGHRRPTRGLPQLPVAGLPLRRARDTITGEFVTWASPPRRQTTPWLVLLNLDNSPQQRGRVDQPQVTMDALRDLFRGELQMAVGQLNDKVGRLEAAMQVQHGYQGNFAGVYMCVYMARALAPFLRTILLQLTDKRPPKARPQLPCTRHDRQME